MSMASQQADVKMFKRLQAIAVLEFVVAPRDPNFAALWNRQIDVLPVNATMRVIFSALRDCG